jgi:hypothetical protein
MSVIIKGGISNTLADVDSNNNLKVNLPVSITGTGYVTLVAEPDAGTITGSKLRRALDASQDYRLRVGTDKVVWQDTFNHGVLNNYKYIGVTSTQTIVVGGGFLTLNAGSSVANATVARVQTFKTFSLFNSYPLIFNIRAKHSAAFQTNSVTEFGLGYAATTVTPTDGVFFRITSGILLGVINNNGSETTVTTGFVPTVGAVDEYVIIIGQDRTEFWVDGILRGTILTPSSLGSPCQSNSLPILLRNYNSGIVTTAYQFAIAQIAITIGDMDSGKDWATLMTTNGQSAISNTDGQAAGYTSNNVNITAPASATLSNTLAGYATLGGQFQFAAVGSLETDYALFAYLNPAGTAVIPGKTLVITGVKIDTFNTVVAVATTPTLLQWTIGVGGTAVSLLTTDSIVAGTRAPRRLSLGTQCMLVGTAAGANCDRNLDVKFSTPLIVENGSYCHIILKMPVATATATEIIRGTVMINGYFE